MKQEHNSEKLRAAREYELAHSKEIPREQRPAFHVSVPVGWMNDPNGFSMFEGNCHLFFQYHPYSTSWGPMHWGHYVTKDFIRWEPMPCALAPEMDYDRDGCFSGTALEWDGKHILMYTGVKESVENDGTRKVRQTQCIAVGDGTDYIKSGKNPVITADLLPEGCSEADFRDPKLWRDETGFWSVVGSKSADGNGRLALFFSENALDWEFVKMLDDGKNEYGEMWECPDFFPLCQRQVLIVSPQFMEADGREFHSGNNTIYFIGEYDAQSRTWVRKKPHIVDFGLDFYAAQTVETADQRRIMTAWLQSWDNYMKPDGYAWSGMMTVPRELSVKNDRLLQWPVRELEAYRKNRVAYENYKLDHAQAETAIPGITGRIADILICLKKGEYQTFYMAVAADSAHRTLITYEKDRGLVTVDRSRSGIKKDVICTRSMDVEEDGGELRMRILMDKNSIEVFVNEGERAMTTLIYTPQEAQEIFFGTDGYVLLDIEKYEIAAD